MLLKNSSILIVDDDTDVLTAVRLLLKTEVKEVVTEKKPENIRWHLSKDKFDVILLDMNFTSSINTGNEGIFWLNEIKKMHSDASVIMITAYGDIDLAVRSLKEGAADFVVKPWHNEKLLSIIREALKRKSNKSLSAASMTDSILGKGLIGESDVMKEIFIKVDVGALTETIFESELFGHKKGAFTDAKEDRIGRFEVANGGTIFLDEIGNIPLHLQAKLLSVLQNRQIIRVGSNELIPVNIRLICATNLALSELANENRFRKDLIYRINTVEITMPPLRKRGNDIILLARYFSKMYTNKYMKPDMEFDTKALEKLMTYNYPGNIRELQYIIERAVIMSDGNVLQAQDLIFSPIESQNTSTTDTGELKLSAIEKNTILRVIEKHNGNITKAAKELGLTRTALYRRLSKYDI